MNKPRVLVFSCVAPLPTDRGDRVRVFHMLHLLRNVADVRLVCLERDWEPPVTDWSVWQGIDVRTLVVHKREVIWEGTKALLRGMPYLAFRFAPTRVVEFVKREIADYQPDFFWGYGIYAYPFLHLATDARRILDLADSPTLYSLMSRTAADVPLTARLQSIVQWRLADIEGAALAASNHVIVCSRPNADHLRHTHAHTDHLTVLPNCVPSSLLEQPWSADEAQSRRVLFVGNLAYPPNAAGVRTFIMHIWPHIRAQEPQAEFVVCGPHSEALQRELGPQAGVRFLGFVDDLVAMYRSARALVVPVAFASGVQTKLIEALAVGVPVVTSYASARANGVQDQQEVLVGETLETFATAVLAVLHNDSLTERLSERGRAFVRKYHTWESQQPVLENILSYQAALH